MLGVVDNPLLTPADEAMRQVACEMGVGETFRLAPVGVFFGPAGGPAGSPARRPVFRGGGAGQAGVPPLRRVHDGLPLRGQEHPAHQLPPSGRTSGCSRRAAHDGSFAWSPSRAAGGSCGPRGRPRSVPGGSPAGAGGYLTAGQVVLAAGAFGTQKLLQTMALEGKLPELSARLGELTRTNSESLLGATVASGRPHPDFSRGVAITSLFLPWPGTHAEPVRYGHGSNMMGLFGTLLVKGRTDGGASNGGAERRPGWARWLATAARDPCAMLASFDLRAWSERTVIALVMQSHDNSLTVSAKRGLLWPRLTSRQGHGQPSPAWLPIGHDLARRLAKRTGGRPAANWGEIFGMPLTAHFLGGCTIGASRRRRCSRPLAQGLFVPRAACGRRLRHPANPGANPALTITALAERAFSYWPNNGGPDPRPPLGAARVALAVPVVPAGSPVVPAGAQGELRFRRTASK